MKTIDEHIKKINETNPEQMVLAFAQCRMDLEKCQAEKVEYKEIINNYKEELNHLSQTLYKHAEDCVDTIIFLETKIDIQKPTNIEFQSKAIPTSIEISKG